MESVISSRTADDVTSFSPKEIQCWAPTTYKVNDNPIATAVFVANPQRFKLSTIMWGVFLGNLLTGIVGVVLYAIIR
jgi:hypothetical protein